MKKKVVYCHYVSAWIPLGRSRERCPKCGAVLRAGSTHPVMDA